MKKKRLHNATKGFVNAKNGPQRGQKWLFVLYFIEHHDPKSTPNVAQKAISGLFEGHFRHSRSLLWHYGAFHRALRGILGLES